jgi:DNA-binding response OmpR family regulator
MAAAAPDILIAATDIDQRLLECLADCRATLVRSFEEAQRVLREHWFRMVVIDVNFDQARTSDLLQHVRSLADMNGMPVLCVQGPVGFLGATRRPPRIEAQTRRCVLIVDSNVDAAHRLAELVEAAGHEVDLAYDARAGLDAARRLRPDVVFVGVAEHGLAPRLRGEPALRDVPIHCLSKPPDRESIRTLL